MITEPDTTAEQAHRDTPSTDEGVRRVARNSLAPFAANMAGRVLAWGMAVVMARALGPTGTGAYALVVNMWLYASIVTDFGLGTWLTREVARDPSGAPQAVRLTLAVRLALVALAVPLLVGAAALYAAGGADVQIVATAALLGIGLLPGAVSAAVTAVFNAHEAMVFPAGVQLAGAAITMAAGAALLLAGHGIVALGWVSLGVNVLSAALFASACARRFFPLGMGVQLGRQMAILRDALPLMLNSLLNNVFFRADVQVLQSKGSAVVGYYANAYKVLDAAGAVPSSFVLALFPVMARRATEIGADGSLARIYRLAAKLLMTVALPLAVLVSFGATDLTRWFWGAAFLPDSARALQILIWFLPLSFFNGLTQYVLISLGLQRRITPAFALAAAFNLAANLLLIPRYSYVAAAGVTIATEVVLLVPFLWALGGRVARRPLVAAAARPVPAAVVMAAVLLVVAPWSRGAAALAAAAVYLPTLWATQAFDVQERAALRGLAPAWLRPKRQ